MLEAPIISSVSSRSKSVLKFSSYSEESTKTRSENKRLDPSPLRLIIFEAFKSDKIK